MIYLQELFDDLAYGEFAGIAAKSNVFASIKEEDYGRIISFINQGLRDIYTRLELRKGEFKLYHRTGQTIYYLRDVHVGDPTSSSSLYIEDINGDLADSPCIKLIKAFDADDEEVRINMSAYPDDIFLMANDIIKLTPTDPLGVISIVYQGGYEKITMSNAFDADAYALYFPDFIRKAILAFVASRYFVGKTSTPVEGQPSINSTFLYKYEIELQRIVDNFLVPVEDQNDDQRFIDLGWE